MLIYGYFSVVNSIVFSFKTEFRNTEIKYVGLSIQKFSVELNSIRPNIFSKIELQKMPSICIAITCKKKAGSWIFCSLYFQFPPLITFFIQIPLSVCFFMCFTPPSPMSTSCWFFRKQVHSKFTRILRISRFQKWGKLQNNRAHTQKDNNRIVLSNFPKFCISILWNSRNVFNTIQVFALYW